jgi:hypothetical protein
MSVFRVIRQMHGSKHKTLILWAVPASNDAEIALLEEVGDITVKMWESAGIPLFSPEYFDKNKVCFKALPYHYGNLQEIRRSLLRVWERQLRIKLFLNFRFILGFHP